MDALIEVVLREATEGLIASSLAAALVLLLRTPARRAFGARVAYGLWWLLPAALLSVWLPAPSVVAPAVQMASTPSVGIAAPVSITAVQASAFHWQDLLLLAWVFGVLASIAWMLQAQRAFARALGPLQRSGDGLWRARSTHGLPAVVGLPPRIVLPADFEHRYGPEQRALVIAHERVHLRRGDVYWNFGFALLCALQWFNPLLRLAQRAFRLDQELACDARVLDQQPALRRCYAEALLGTTPHIAQAPLGCPAFGAHPLKERIKMLSKPLPSTAARVGGWLLTVSLGAGLGGLAWAQQAPRLIEGGLVDVRMQLSAGGSTENPRVITQAGNAFAVGIDDAEGKTWKLELRALPDGDDFYRLSGEVSHAGRVVARPDQRLPAGERVNLDLAGVAASQLQLALSVSPSDGVPPPPPPPAPSAPNPPAPPAPVAAASEMRGLAPPAPPATPAPPAPPAAPRAEEPAVPATPATAPPPPPAPSGLAAPTPPAAPAAPMSSSALARPAPGVLPRAPKGDNTEVAYREMKPPSYPKEAMAQRQQGTVVVQVLVEDDGSVGEIELGRSSGFAALDRAAMEAVAGWRFHPAKREGRRVASRIEVPVSFALNASDDASTPMPEGASAPTPESQETPAPEPDIAAREIQAASYRRLSAPEYPQAAKDAGQQGTTLLKVGLDAEGRPLTVDIVASSGSDLLDRAAANAVERWSFEPARSDGRAVASQALVPVQFVAAGAEPGVYAAPPGALDTITLRAD
jgi:bla regulator protein BlaR1